MTLEISIQVEAEKIRDSVRVKLGDLDITTQLDEGHLEEIRDLLGEEEFDSLQDPIDPPDFEEEVG